MTHLRYPDPEPIADYRSHGARALPLASGAGTAHAYLLEFDAGGEIGEHVAGFDQLFFVLTGTAWLEVDGERSDLAAREAATVALGQRHRKGSHDGATVLMLQFTSLHDPTVP